MNTNQIYSSISDDNLDNYLFWLPSARALSFDRSARDCLLPSCLGYNVSDERTQTQLLAKERTKKAFQAKPAQTSKQLNRLRRTTEHHNRIKNLFESFLSIFSFPQHFAYGTGKWNRHTISLGGGTCFVEHRGLTSSSSPQKVIFRWKLSSPWGKLVSNPI